MVNKCFLYKKDGESVDHIHLHCARSRVLWNLLSSLFKIVWVMSSSLREILLR